MFATLLKFQDAVLLIELSPLLTLLCIPLTAELTVFLMFDQTESALEYVPLFALITLDCMELQLLWRLELRPDIVVVIDVFILDQEV